MANDELIKVIESYKEWKALEEEASAQRKALEEQIKEVMEARGTEELSIGRFIVRFTSILSNRFDSTAFKKAFPDVYKAFTKAVASRRFTISE